MKFLMVIVSEEYQKRVSDIFAYHECSATVIASNGDFLEYGETIYLLAIEEHKVDIVLTTIEKELGVLQKEKGVVLSSEESANHARVIAYNMGIDTFMKIGGGTLIDDQGEREGTIL